MSKEKSFLRFGGIAGILAGIFFICTIVTLINFGNPATANATELVTRFPDHRTGLAVGNAFYFLVSVSLVGLALGLYQGLRRQSPVIALYGTVLYVLGLGVTFVEDATQVAFDPISNLYNAAGATAADQATLTLLWQATQGMFNQFDVAATLLLSTGLIVLGVAMIQGISFWQGLRRVERGDRRGSDRGDIFPFDQFCRVRPLRPSRLLSLPCRLRMEALQPVKGRIRNLKDRCRGDPAFTGSSNTIDCVGTPATAQQPVFEGRTHLREVIT